MLGINEIAKWGLVRRNEFEALVARVTALESGGGDLTHLDLTDVDWTLRGNSKINFDTRTDTAGFYAGGLPVVTFYYDGGLYSANIGGGLRFLEIGAGTQYVQVGKCAQFLCIGEEANNVQVANFASRAYFGEGAGCTYIGAEFGNNTYFGLCSSGCGGDIDLRCIDVTNAQWTLRGNSKINFMPACSSDTSGIFVGLSCMLAFNSTADGVSAWIASHINSAFIGENVCTLNIGSYSCEMDVGRCTYCLNLGNTARYLSIGEYSEGFVRIAPYASYVEMGTCAMCVLLGCEANWTSIGTSTGSNTYYGI